MSPVKTTKCGETRPGVVHPQNSDIAILDRQCVVPPHVLTKLGIMKPRVLES